MLSIDFSRTLFWHLLPNAMNKVHGVQCHIIIICRCMLWIKCKYSCQHFFSRFQLMPMYNTDSGWNYDHNKLRHNVYTANDKLNTKSLQRDILLCKAGCMMKCNCQKAGLLQLNSLVHCSIPHNQLYNLKKFLGHTRNSTK